MCDSYEYEHLGFVDFQVDLQQRLKNDPELAKEYEIAKERRIQENYGYCYCNKMKNVEHLIGSEGCAYHD